MAIIRPDKKIKVVHLSNHDFSIKVHSRNQMIFLLNRGYDVSMICNPGEFVKKDMMTPEGMFVKALSFKSRITPMQDLHTLVKLYNYFKKQAFDIVHTHMIKPGLLGRLAAKLAGVPVILHTVHGFFFNELMKPLESRLYAGIEKYGALMSDMILSQNKEDIERALQMGICKSSKITYLGNGIDIGSFHPSRKIPELVEAKRQEIGINNGRKIICQIARLVDHKGYEDFFRAAKILKMQKYPAIFLAIGQKHHKKGAVDVEKIIAELKLDGYAKFLSVRDDIPDLIAAVDLIVLASWGVEGIPRVLMECAAAGKPAVATNVRGNREAIVDGKTGLLVPPRNPAILAEAIKSLLDNPEHAESMGVMARRHAEKYFDERLYFKKTDTIYRQLITKKLSIL